MNTLNTEAHNVRNKWKNSLSGQLLQTVEHKLLYITEKKNHYQHKLKIQRKFNNLYNGSNLFPNNDDKFLNLSDHELTQPQKDFLNLGTTRYLFNGFKHVQKQTEVEVLYQDILKPQEQNQAKTKPQLRKLLKAEATKNRSNNKDNYSSILTRQIQNVAEHSHKHPDISIKK